MSLRDTIKLTIDYSESEEDLNEIRIPMEIFF